MKIAMLSLALLIASGAAHAQRGERNSTDAVGRACSVKECFLESDIRDFEVIDRTHVIVYVGQQRCAFHLELNGTMCDLSFAPELYFRRLNEVPQITSSGARNAGDPSPVMPRVGSRATDFDTFELQQRERRDLRICGNDLTIQVHGGAFTESQSSGLGTDRFGNPRTDCRVSSVTSVTDDQLLEFYVARGVVAPVPPMGTGEIEVGEQEEQGAERPASRRGENDAREPD